MIEAPYLLLYAINMALMVISWHENLPRDEQPPRHIWWSEKLLDEWFEQIRAEREERGGKKKPRSSYADADDAPMTQNEYAARFRPKG